jgi:ribosomal protein S18 acetylase RimI-like enzyme
VERPPGAMFPEAYSGRMGVELREIDESVREDLQSVRLGPGQDHFVSTVEGSLAEAAQVPEANPWYRAVYADGEAIGFVMISWDLRPVPPGFRGPWFLWKLIIDHDHQRRGHGREVVTTIADLVREHGGTELMTSHVDGPGGPKDFYLGLGFVPTGEVDEDGEILLALPL